MCGLVEQEVILETGAFCCPFSVFGGHDIRKNRERPLCSCRITVLGAGRIFAGTFVYRGRMPRGRSRVRVDLDAPMAPALFPFRPPDQSMRFFHQIDASAPWGTYGYRSVLAVSIAFFSIRFPSRERLGLESRVLISPAARRRSSPWRRYPRPSPRPGWCGRWGRW